MQKNKQTKKSKKDSKMISKRVSVPVASGYVNTSVPALVSAGGGNAIVVKHREFVRDIYGMVEFQNNSWDINPGLPNLFPWMSHIASNYESYTFRSLNFVYEPSCATTAYGGVMMMVDFDSNDPDPVAKQGFMSNHRATRCPPWAPGKVSCDPSDLKKFAKERYVRGGNVANSDIRNYDVGKLHIATQGAIADNAIYGEIYVEYVVEFKTPQYNIVTEALENSGHIASGGIMSLAKPWGLDAVVDGGVPIKMTSDDKGINILEAGEYLISMYCTGVGLATTPDITTGNGNTTNVLSFMANAAATAAWLVMRVRNNNPGLPFKLDFTGHATSLAATATYIANYAFALI